MHCIKRIVPRRLQHDSVRKRLESSAAGSKIQIPSRIERGPTDILAALESTVANIPSLPKYKFIDDPFTLPVSRVQYRSYAMAREAGKKAAMWVQQEHPELFERNIADPEIPAFQPPQKYTDASQVSEQTVETLIRQKNVKDVIEVYDLLEGKIPDETKLSLFQFLCFYNCLEVPSEDLYEDRWIIKDNLSETNSWTDARIILDIFQYLIKQGPEMKAMAYNTYICGMAKYFCVTKAWQLFNTCVEENIPLALNTYNYILPTVPVMAGADAKKEELILEIFSRMSSQGVKPNVNTLNGALKATLKMLSPQCQRFAMRLFTDFKRMDIKPCLASYYYALNIFSKEGENTSYILENILEDLEVTDLEIQNLNDTKFFPMAMQIAAEEYNSRATDRVHALFLAKKNYKFINKSYYESIYYRYYMLAKLNSLDIKEFFKLYTDITPSIYIPEPDVMEQILQTVQLSSPATVQEQLPLLWSHFIQFNFVERKNLLQKILQITEEINSVLTTSDRLLFAEHVRTVWELLMKMRGKQHERLVIDTKVISTMAMILTRADFLPESMLVLTFLSENVYGLTGYLSKQHARELCEYYISKENCDGPMLLIQYFANTAPEEASEIAKLVVQKLTLSKSQKAKLENLLGPDRLKELEESEVDETSRNS